MGAANILSLYAPTVCSEAETKNYFYESLDSVVSNITDLTLQKDVPKPHDAGKNLPEHIDVTWLHLRETIYNTSIAVLGKKERKSADWFEANWEIMEPVTEAKRKALMAYKVAPGTVALQKLRNARNIARMTELIYA